MSAAAANSTMSTMSRRVRWSLVPAAQLGAHAEAWDRLNAETFDTPLLAANFIAEALTQFGDGAEVLALGESNGSLTAACILRRDGPLQMKSFDPPQLPVCPWLQRVAPAQDDVFDGLVKALPLHVMLLSLLRLDPLFVSLPASSDRAAKVPYIVTGRIDLPDDLEAYWASLTRKFVGNVRRRMSKAQQVLGAIEFDVATAPEAMEQGVRDYAALEEGGWKGDEGTAVAVGSRQFDFYTNSLHQMAQLGEARVFRLRIGGRLAAMQLALARGSRMYLLKTSYDEALSDFSPGVLLKWMLIDNVHKAEPPTRTIEIYGKLSEAHRPLVTDTRETYHMNHFRTSMLARMHAVTGRLRNRENN